MKLISLYCYICDRYDTALICHCQRFGNRFINTSPEFTDEEVICVYLFAIICEGKTQIKSIHSHAKRYWLSWFPKLPSYEAFNTRLNRLSDCFPVLVEMLLSEADKSNVVMNCNVIDSMPVITCSSKRQGKVARELTDKGYCATKGLHYYGLKLHIIAQVRTKSIPMPEYIAITSASEHDLTAVRSVLLNLINRKIFADKAYADEKLNEKMEKEQGSYIFTPVKILRGHDQRLKEFDQAITDLWSTAVSTIRQPIESLFNWLQVKTNIENASKVRSAKGLIVHCFGKIAAAIALWVF